jgi:hypothetical protein
LLFYTTAYRQNGSCYELKLVLNKFDGALCSYPMPVRNDLVNELCHEGNKCVLCCINCSEVLSLAFVDDGNGGFFLMFNTNTTLSRDESKYGIPIFEEMSEWLYH